ncbi:MAG: CTP synthase [Alphaproteobacteria bacterium]|nr:MAG: CTP synthase [Alphaproteobacteria bacterium]
MTHYIFITGGVVSSLGKGICGSSLAALLQARGLRVHMRKFDPYLNVDPGTMSPYQHGEVFVTHDGAETDLDLGHYERFTDQQSTRYDSVSSGQIYRSVIEAERRGDYLGATIQVIPHVTTMIKQAMMRDIDDGIDYCIIEIGGTVGDIESLPFLEAIRQLRADLGRERTLFAHVTLVPYIPAAGELKTKPSQHSVKELLGLGIQPDILVCRSSVEIPASAREKLALFCNIRPENVIAAHDVSTIYAVPQALHEEGFDRQVLQYFGYDPATNPANIEPWINFVSRIQAPNREVTLGIIGKYTGLVDVYKSICESLIHAGAQNNTKVHIRWVDSESLEPLDEAGIGHTLGGLDGILVPGGFGHRGVEGKVRAITYARIHAVPVLGICLGMQMMVVEAARNLLGLSDAGSSEFGETPHPVVGLMTEWIKDTETINRHTRGDLGGTMRLGAYPCILAPGTHAQKLYGCSAIVERHRHRYEVCATYVPDLAKKGFVFSGMSPEGDLPEIVEITSHPYFIGVQFHPEFCSRPTRPHPLFDGLVRAMGMGKNHS